MRRSRRSHQNPLALFLAVMSCAFISLAGHLPAGTDQIRLPHQKLYHSVVLAE